MGKGKNEKKDPRQAFVAGGDVSEYVERRQPLRVRKESYQKKR